MTASPTTQNPNRPAPSLEDRIREYEQLSIAERRHARIPLLALMQSRLFRTAATQQDLIRHRLEGAQLAYTDDTADCVAAYLATLRWIESVARVQIQLEMAATMADRTTIACAAQSSRSSTNVNA